MRTALVVVCLVLFSAVFATAGNTPIDPHVIISGGGGSMGISEFLTSGFSLTGAGSPCSAADGGGFNCDFFNDLGVTITSLDLFISDQGADKVITCGVLSGVGGNANCSVNGLTVHFTNLDIPAESNSVSAPVRYSFVVEDPSHFRLFFDDQFLDTTHSGIAANTPEPGTMILMGSGILAMISRRRKKLV